MPSPKCTVCGVTKTFENTHRDARKPDGLHTKCKICKAKGQGKTVAKSMSLALVPAVPQPRCGLIELVPDDKPLVFDRYGERWTTSLDVAKKFERPHKDVLDNIRQIIELTPMGGRRNFSPTSYHDEWNRQQPCYNLTRAGFSVLAMGFTGERALAWKWRYIEAFKSLEDRAVKTIA
jgi:Rha family phage regulatory protein